MKKPSNVLKVPATLDNFFLLWLMFLKPYHQMTDRQISLAAQFLKERYELGKIISDEKLRDENVMSEATKKKIREAINVSPAFFHGLMGDLRKHKFIIDGHINPKYIPNLDKKPDIFTLMLYFDFSKK